MTGATSDEGVILAELQQRAYRMAESEDMQVVYLAIGTLYVLDLLWEARCQSSTGSGTEATTGSK